MATRKREYGMLQCVGLTDKQLSSIVVKEGILYSVGSISISLILELFLGLYCVMYLVPLVFLEK